MGIHVMYIYVCGVYVVCVYIYKEYILYNVYNYIMYWTCCPQFLYIISTQIHVINCRPRIQPLIGKLKWQTPPVQYAISMEGYEQLFK